MGSTRRTTARVLPVSADGSCLLLLERDPARPDEPYWGVVGGAVDPGETPAQAASREMREETGIAVDAGGLTGPVHRRACAYTWNGVAYEGEAHVFTVRLPRTTPISFDDLEPEEVGNVLDSGWLTPDQAAADGRLMWPDLPEIMELAVAVSSRAARSGGAP